MSEPGWIWRALSVAGFLCLVGAYLANQRGACSPSSRRYLLANAVGSGLLTAYSAVIGEWVFVALEGFWCAASLWALRAPVGPRGAALLLAALALSAAGCGDDAPPPQPPGLLFANLSNARLVACANSVLPEDIRAVAGPLVRLRRQLTWGDWREMPRLTGFARNQDRPADLHVWKMVTLTPEPLSDPVVWRGGATVPFALPTDAGETFWWLPDRGLLLVEARTPPEGIAIEYDARREQVFGVWEPFSPGARTSPAAQRRRASLGAQMRDLLLLPAPSALEIDVAVPEGGSLRFAVGVAEAGWRRVGEALQHADGLSDGVEFALEVRADGATQRAWTRTVLPEQGFVEEHVDLSAWSGKTATLRLLAAPGKSADFDYAVWSGLVLEAPRATPPRPNVVIVDIDTLRADRLSCYGHVRPTSPRLDAWAEQALLFSDAWSTASWTLPATASMLTGMDVKQHGVLLASRAIGPASPTLAERLAKEGYETVAWAGGGFVGPGFGMDRGFQSFRVDEADFPDDELAGWLRARRGGPPLLLFVHTYAVHMPYAADDRFALPGHGCGALGDTPIDSAGIAEPFHAGAREISHEERSCIDRRYDAGIARLDAQLGPLLAAIDETLGAERTLVIVTSDHGEELFEHGGLEHGRTLYEEILDVPLIVAFPGRGPRGRNSEPVSLLDIVPTALDVVGLPLPKGLPGRALLGPAPPHRPRVATYSDDTHAISLDGRKLIHGYPEARDPTAPWPPDGLQLFDLHSDPQEAKNAAAKDPELVANLSELLEQWLTHWPSAGGSGAAAPNTGDFERLKALGYTGER